MGFPKLDIEYSKSPVALVLNANNELRAYKVKTQKSKFFIMEDKIFEVDPSAFIRMDKTPIYFYYTEYPKPINLKYHSMLHKWAKNNGVDKIRKKDIKQSSLFDRYKVEGNGDALKMVREHEKSEHDEIQKEVENINQKLLQENEKRIADNQPPLEIDPQDYSHYIIESLLKTKKISMDDASILRSGLLSGELTIDDFITKLNDLHLVEISEPIPLNPRLWLDSAASYNPSAVFNYIKATRNLDKKIEKLGLTQVKQLIPAAWIAMVLIGVSIAIAVLVSSGAGNYIASFLHLK